MRETLTAIPSHRVAPEVDGFTSRPDCSAHLIVKIEPSDQRGKMSAIGCTGLTAKIGVLYETSKG